MHYGNNPDIIEVQMIYPEEKIAVREVGLRDGLQLVKTYPSTAAKLDWIKQDYLAGIRYFEAGSYLPAKHFPQFEDINTLVKYVRELDGAFSSVLALNKRGAIRALEGQTHEITCVISASEEHNLRNARRTRKQGLKEISDVLELRADSDRRPLVSVGIAMGFGCSIQGNVDLKDVLSIAEKCAEMGVDTIGVADTVGYGGPKDVAIMVSELRMVVGKLPVCMHFHDTRGMGIANVAAALDSGIRIFDASLGGLGGCPFAPKATGNVVLEDVIFLCEKMGFETGVDIPTLAPARSILQREMPDEQLYGQLAKAGLPSGQLAMK